MSRYKLSAIFVLITIILTILENGPVFAEYVGPIEGFNHAGGYPGVFRPEVWFDGQSMLVCDGDGQLGWRLPPDSNIPVLRTLIPPDEFDPNMPWSVLIDKAYNFHYGWGAYLIDEYNYPFPPQSAIWFQVLNQSPELETYYDVNFAPLFGTSDTNGNPSSDIWLWDMRECFNYYAVPQNYYGRLFATYKIYLGDETTGIEFVDSNGDPCFGSTIVTLHWEKPYPYILQGDAGLNGKVDFSDYVLLAKEWLNSSCPSPYWCDESDIDKSGNVDIADLDLLAENWLIDCSQLPLNPECIPRFSQ